MLAAALSLRIARIASTPLIAPSCRSISVTSGWYLRCRATASSPEAASATTSMSDWRLMMREMPSRTIRWSSTQSTRILRPDVGMFLDPGGLRHDRDDLGPGRRRGRDVQRAADLFGALSHRDQSVMAVRRALHAGIIETAAVVRDGQRDVVGPVVEADADARGGGVADGVGNRFLSDPQELLLDPGNPQRRRAVDVDVDGDSGRRSRLLG